MFVPVWIMVVVVVYVVSSLGAIVWVLFNCAVYRDACRVWKKAYEEKKEREESGREQFLKLKGQHKEVCEELARMKKERKKITEHNLAVFKDLKDILVEAIDLLEGELRE